MIYRCICPDCKNRLIKKKEGIYCDLCKRYFKNIKGILILLPKNLSDFKKTEINFYKEEFANQKDSFKFVDRYWNRNFLGLLDFMEVFRDLPKDSKILELGAGNGQYSLILKKRGFRNIFISDISLNGLSAAKEYSKEDKEEDNHFFVFDAENLPFESCTFDVIFMAASLHHLQNPQKCIKEMKRCVKRGGFVIVALEPNSWYYYILRPIAKMIGIRRIDKSKDLFSIGDETTHGFSMGTLKRYFKENKIRIIKKQRVWYTAAIVYYLPDMLIRSFYRRIPTEPKLKESCFTQTALKIDEVIKVVPFVNKFSFHNTIIGVKR